MTLLLQPENVNLTVCPCGTSYLGLALANQFFFNTTTVCLELDVCFLNWLAYSIALYCSVLNRNLCIMIHLYWQISCQFTTLVLENNTDTKDPIQNNCQIKTRFLFFLLTLLYEQSDKGLLCKIAFFMRAPVTQGSVSELQLGKTSRPIRAEDPTALWCKHYSRALGIQSSDVVTGK